MDPARRDFLRTSATTTAALTLGPMIGGTAAAAEPAPTAREAAEDPRAMERRLLRAHPIPLEKIRLTGGPLKHAQELTASYLLSLDPDRMLHFYRVRAGLRPKGEPYSGWDGGGRNLTGHIAGHHLSAVSLMYAATGDARFKGRADYVVREFDEVQRKHGDGYLGALEGLPEAFARLSRGEIKSGGFDLNGLWSPWYTLHKTYAGLRDAHRYAGSARALPLEVNYATWAERVIAPLSEAQVQTMLNTEFGGMNEVFADLYADTSDARWLALSHRFEHHAVTLPLKRHEDNLSGKHGNCQIPKLIGSAARYGYTGDLDDIVAASFFWDRVVRHHSYASGGHGLNEYFGEPDVLSPRVDGRAAETCNVYNMIKLTRRLFALRPDAAYADFHERALFNHILASIDPQDGRTSYMVPVGRAEQQEYQDMQRDFTCCVGSGMESHALHGLGVFFDSADTIWVNLFVPSIAESRVAGARLTMETGFPDGDSATITLTLPEPAKFTIAVRRPVWAGDGFRVAVNGTDQPQPALDTLYDPVAGGRAGGPGNESVERNATYVLLTRIWTTGDTVTLALPKTLHLQPTADDPQVTAIMWGPLALAADVGPRQEEPWSESPSTPPPTPVRLLVSASGQPADFLRPASRPGNFTVASGVARIASADVPSGEVSLTPFYRTHRRRYALYHDVVTPAEFDTRRVKLTAEREAAALLERATVGRVVLGDEAQEASANYRSDLKDRVIGSREGHTSRAGAGWFSLDVAVDPAAPMLVLVTYFVERGLPAQLAAFEIQVDGTTVGHYVPRHDASGFYDARYDVPEAVTRGKGKITVRFQAQGASTVVPVFAVRSARR
ncbi:MAG: beta-L-arabinofuranosidase domain-containing protein [Gemmatimonadota bacterium]